MGCFRDVMLSMPTEDAELLEKLAGEMGTTQSSVVRRALQLLVSHNRTINQARSTDSAVWKAETPLRTTPNPNIKGAIYKNEE